MTLVLCQSYDATQKLPFLPFKTYFFLTICKGKVGKVNSFGLHLASCKAEPLNL